MPPSQLLPSLTDLLYATLGGALDSGGISQWEHNTDDLLLAHPPMLSNGQRDARLNSSYLNLNSTPSPDESSASYTHWHAPSQTHNSESSPEYSQPQSDTGESSTTPPTSHQAGMNDEQVQDLKNWADRVSTAQNLTAAQVADMHSVVNVSLSFQSDIACFNSLL